MATRSINEKVVIKDEATLLRLNYALQQPSYFADVKPITDEEVERREELGQELFEKWLSNH